ncbi:hypothetical protein cyc_01441 [Cyclospora cayetanensis]|uniref:Uncharacterized protein n=1 Tax=Cyclospora cayetanensis TaxID=88456 RepID=A0A1D3D5V6_9EIME|nr:hypothetical protein cyc_01441 [Cyclospora cayetanensis]
MLWRDRSAASPALVTSRFSLGGIRDFRLKLFPAGNPSSKPDHISIHLEQLEIWRALVFPITLTVGGVSQGPFKFRSPEYFQAANSFCKIEDLKLEGDSLHVRVEISPG